MASSCLIAALACFGMSAIFFAWGVYDVWRYLVRHRGLADYPSGVIGGKGEPQCNHDRN